jgi:hypothetical protein
MAGTLWPQYQGVVFTISQPATFCEIALTLWLVIKGAKVQELGASESPVEMALILTTGGTDSSTGRCRRLAHPSRLTESRSISATSMTAR